MTNVRSQIYIKKMGKDRKQKARKTERDLNHIGNIFLTFGLSIFSDFST